MDDTMDVKTLAQTPSWKWPGNAGATLLGMLRDARAPESDRALAAQLAGDLVVMNDDVAEVLLSILQSGSEPEQLRGRAAIALGAVLEDGDLQGFDDPDVVAIAEPTFHRIRKSLHAVFTDARVPDAVRRSVLEASVRAPEPWHRGALRAAWVSGDDAWKVTALFGMGHVPGFENEILQTLESANPDLRYEAVVAAGNREIDAAWPCITEIITSPRPDKALLLAAIDAAPGIRPAETPALLIPLEGSNDEDVAAAVEEALAMATALSDIGGEEDGENDEEDDDEDEEPDA
jgi:hypothetical protein